MPQTSQLYYLCNIEYQIVIPNELQILTTEFLLATQKYELLAFLCHNNIIKDDPKIFGMIYEKG